MPDFKNFFGAAPSDQNALDLFAGEWSSRMPLDRADLKAGETPLFDDPRIKWADDKLTSLGLVGGMRDRDVLELGPLEGGHSFLLDRLGAKSVTAVEANSRAYLKCLLAKETLGMPRVRFLLGDCLEYLRAPGPRFDAAVACGILYHLTNPVELIELLAKRCDALFLWTVYFDPEFVAKNPVPARSSPTRLKWSTTASSTPCTDSTTASRWTGRDFAAAARSSATGWRSPTS